MPAHDGPTLLDPPEAHAAWDRYEAAKRRHRAAVDELDQAAREVSTAWRRWLALRDWAQDR